MRVQARRALAAGALLVLIAAGVEAGTSWTSTSNLTVSARSPPAVFEHGANANSSRYVANLAISPAATSFSGSFKGRAGAEVVVTDVVRLKSTVTTDLTVTLTGSAVTSPRVIQFSWDVRNGSSSVATLDHKTASPSASFVLPAGASFVLDLHDILAKGSGKNDANVAFNVGVSVS